MNVQATLAKLAVGKRFAVGRRMDKLAGVATGAVGKEFTTLEDFPDVTVNRWNCHGAQNWKENVIVKLLNEKQDQILFNSRGGILSYFFGSLFSFSLLTTTIDDLVFLLSSPLVSPAVDLSSSVFLVGGGELVILMRFL